MRPEGVDIGVFEADLRPKREEAIEAVIFDTDGVVTDTATVHFAAWKRLFDAFLKARAAGGDFEPFTEDDYRRFVDGVPRYDGVAAFLESRGIELAWGSPDDPPDDETVCGLGNRKNGYFRAHLREDGVQAFASTVRFVEELDRGGIRTAVISASRNCAEVLAAAGVDRLFEVRVDGIDAEALGLAGKPDPAVFLEAARRLGVEPTRAAIVEDAIAGVEAARRGGFGLVIGIDRVGHPDALAKFADLVVGDLSELTVTAGQITHRATAVPSVTADRVTSQRLIGLPSALDPGELERALSGRQPAVLLDYDGTLTPIVARPELAVLPEETLAVLERLAGSCTVGIISGRDLDDVRAMVDSDKVWFAGSHGFDLLSPDGRRREIAQGADLLPVLDEAEADLHGSIDRVPEAWIERKRFAIAVHYRQTPDEHVPELRELVAMVAGRHRGLRIAGGKRIFELRPDIAWDKGKAVQWVLEVAGLDRAEVAPIYLGDDETDEDAFVALRDRGTGIVVGDEDRETAARLRLTDPAQVRDLLTRLADLLGEMRG